MGSSPPPSRLLYLFGAMLLIWSINFVVAKIALRHFSPELLACLRVACSAVFGLPILVRELRRESGLALPAKEYLLLYALGTFGVVGNQFVFTLGIARTTIAHAAVMAATFPMLTLLVARVIGQERITRAKVIGMSIALLGVATLQLGRDSATTGVGPSLFGDLLIFVSAIMLAVFTVGGKPVTRRHAPELVISFSYLSGAVTLAPLTGSLVAKTDLGAVPAEGWISLLYMGVLPSVVAYIIYYYVLKYVPASRLAQFAYLQPVLATAFGALILREIPTASWYVGAAMVLSGIVASERL